MSKAWSNIDVLLKQRHDELPKLITICKEYMKHERETLESVIAARNAVSNAREATDIAQLGAAETQLRQDLGRLFALAEAYPKLKADKNFRHLQERISALENGIADRREFYNDSMNLNNIRVEQVPDMLAERIFNFGERDLLRFSEAETADVDVKALFE